MKKKEILSKYHSSFSSVEKGDLVVIKDGSYVLTVKGYDLVDSRIGLSEAIYKIVAVNVNCPSPKSVLDSLTYSNNCIIKSLVDDTIHYCGTINISKVKLDDLSLLDETNINRQILREKAIDTILES